MADVLDDAKDIVKLYECGERLNEVKDKSQHAQDYDNIIKAAKSSSVKARQLAAQLIPRFFKYFPALSACAVDAHLDLCEAEELGCKQYVGCLCSVRIHQSISLKLLIFLHNFSLLKNVERDAVCKALLSLLRQDARASLTALFKHIEWVDGQITDENLREKTLLFIRDKVFPLKAELLKPSEQMERHKTELIKNSLQDVTGAEFKMFMDFLNSLSMFGEKAPPERLHELIEIIEGQADLDTQFNVADVDHIDRLISCLFMALPFFERGASNSKFFNYLNKHIIPVFDKVREFTGGSRGSTMDMSDICVLPEERKVDLLKNLAESSPHTSSLDSRQILPAVTTLLKAMLFQKFMPQRKAEEMNFTYVECLLYAFHHLANKAPNATNCLCDYKIVTGQPSDRLGEDFSHQYKDFSERTQKLNAATGLRTCNNILAMTKPLHSKTPSFVGDKKTINLSWKDAVVKPTATSSTSATGHSLTKNIMKFDNSPSKENILQFMGIRGAIIVELSRLITSTSSS
ncbi:apoptosis inhibitor, partial [Striga asiatica]